MGNGTSLGRVRGLGSAHHGAGHWMLQRFTAIGNLLLLGFLVISFVLLPNFAYDTLIGWIANPVVATALSLIMVNTFWHARIGLQVVAEDYFSTAANKFVALVLMNVAVFGGSAFGLISVARIAFGVA